MSTRVELEFRPATLEDAEPHADVATALDPDEPVDPQIIRYWWTRQDPDHVAERFVVEREGVFVGGVSLRHPSWERLPSREVFVSAVIRPELATSAGWGALYGFIEERARAGGARAMVNFVRETHTELLAYLEASGYRRERIERWWELDLPSNSERLRAEAQVTRRVMQEQGLKVSLLSEVDDPERDHKLWLLNNEGELDIPSTVPPTPDRFEVFMRWLRGPDMHEDRFFVARDGESFVGLSVLSFPPLRGHVRTEFTATSRSHRGRGIARALKVETLVQAIELGVPAVRTENDGKNAPILHLNETLGYREIPGRVELHRPT